MRSWEPAPLPADMFGRTAPTVRVDKTEHGDVPVWNNVASGGPKAKPCAECPFRVEVWGGADLLDYSSAEVREGMWRGHGLSHNGVRDGSLLCSCHLGGTPSPGGGPSTFHECVGTVIVLQRELLRYRAAPSSYPFDRGLTREGVVNFTWHLFGLNCIELLSAPWELIRDRLHPGVTDTGIRHHELDPPTDAELVAWGRPAARDETTGDDMSGVPHREQLAQREGAHDAPKNLRVEDVRPALPEACALCPWRVANQTGDPPQHAGSEPWFYDAETRAAMWEDWGPDGSGLADGIEMTCHATASYVSYDRLRDGAKVHRCTGGVALQQRAVLRWWSTTPPDLGPLRKNAAGRQIVAWMLGLTPCQISGRDWLVNGVQITLGQLVAAAHPAAFNPELGSEQVPPPTVAELEFWAAYKATGEHLNESVTP